MASKQIKETREFPKGCKFVDYVKAPGKRKPFKTVDYGPYGSTGAPMYGIKKHPKAP